MRNVRSALAAYLAADTTIQGLIGQDDGETPRYRVYGDELPQDRAAEMPRAAIVVAAGAGPGDFGVMALERCAVEVVCYGETRLQAEELREAVRGVLKALARVVQDGTLIHSAVPSATPLSTRDQDAKWPLVAEPWTVLASETQVA